MTGQKKKFVVSIIFAVFLSVSLFGIVNVLFSETESNSLPTKTFPTQEPLLSQTLWVIQWLVMAAVVAIVLVGVYVLARRAFPKNLTLPKTTNSSRLFVF